jgi:tRNA pseudouridine(54/55) synthase
MGGSPSSPPLPPHVQRLFEGGVCQLCISRLLSLSRQELAAYRLPDASLETCTACSGIVGALPSIIQAARAAVSRYRYREIQVEIPGRLLAKDNRYLAELNCQSSCSLKNDIKGQLMIALRKSNDGPVLQIAINHRQSYHCQLKWPPVYITGRYFKRSRRVSHSRFMVGSPISSVEGELIAKFTGVIDCSEIKFMSAGREDLDVQMIGTGRPFCLTFLNPTPIESKPPPETIAAFAESFADRLPESGEITCGYGVSANQLHVTAIKPSYETKKIKTYRCVVYCSMSVTTDMLDNLLAVKNLIIQQRTPTRVAHRREMMLREKTVFSLAYKRLSEHFFILDLTTSGGTYIKEFVNSDFGRTFPSLGVLLDSNVAMECQLLQLDVVMVGV